MARPLTKFLSKLLNPDELRKFKGDPIDYINRSHLRPEHKALLKSRDAGRIREAVLREHDDVMEAGSFVWVIGVVDED